MIQRFPALNRDALDRKGWACPVIQGGDIPYAQHEIARQPERFLPPRSEGHAQLEALADRKGNTVLSAEAFRAWPHAKFDRLADIPGTETYDLVYAVRDPLALFRSYWSEEVKQERALSLPERFAEVFVGPLGNRLLNRLTEFAEYRKSPRANLRVIPFDVLAADHVEISAHFMQVAPGVDATKYRRQLPANIRFPVKLTELLRVITVVRGKGRPNVGSAFRLRFMEATTAKDRVDMVGVIEREGRAALRTVRFPERPEFLDILQTRLKQQLPGNYDVAGRGLFAETRLESKCYNAAALLEVPAIRRLVDDVIARVEPLVAPRRIGS